MVTCPEEMLVLPAAERPQMQAPPSPKAGQLFRDKSMSRTQMSDISNAHVGPFSNIEQRKVLEIVYVIESGDKALCPATGCMPV